MSTATATQQWLFPISALEATPSACTLEKEYYDRAKGVEFLFRLGLSLQLPTSALCTAATWLHRFYMRYSLEEFPRQEVAATCLFLATKTEECGRKLLDVAKIYQAKIQNIADINKIQPDSPEVDDSQKMILATEEVLLEALCFDFVVENPHADLVDLFDSCASEPLVQEYAWSLAHDSYRTPLCVLFPPRIIATACFVLAQRLFDGPNSPSLDARISATSPAAHLPTPPSYKPPSPDATRIVVERYGFTDVELIALADTLSILLEFYAAQDESSFPYLSSISSVVPPTTTTARPRLFVPLAQINAPPPQINPQQVSDENLGRTPRSLHGDRSPEPSNALSPTIKNGIP
ncbi:cyclin-like protein [Coprinopsis marcescibilis]|uniref:Cyclin-like protein n=1 Tax=Coprinopsis marcescibilis TaxID=230819 RepID=A0A5C3LA57_COPMA|nr:cyclin-like protein [Coprinopsis marcescibilis]